MTSLEQARAFLKKTAGQLALAVLPLAAVALPAQASQIVFNTTNSSITVSGFDSSQTGASVPTVFGLTGSYVNGIIISGDVTSNWGISGGGAPGSIVLDVSGDGTGSTGVFDTSTIPVNFDFSVSSAVDSVDWSLVFTVDGTTTPFSGTVLGTDVVSSGTGDFINVPNGSALTSWDVNLQISYNQNGGGGSMELLVPNVTSVDILPQDTPSGVPEPATLLLAAPGAAALLLRRRKKNRAA